MTSEQWDRVADLFHAALEHGPEERDAFLRHACLGNRELHQEVSSLLARAEETAGFLEAPALELVGEELARQRAGALTGQRLGPYELQSLVGVGGMGEVYRARDTKLGRDVAIKCLPGSVASDPAARARLQREARILATLNDPHIAAIYGLEEADGVLGLVLELVEGPTLAECTATLPTREALAVAAQVAHALEAAHDKGIIHRDLTPANIVVTPERVVKVLDFGLAKLLAADGSQASEQTVNRTRTGVIAGTAAYMSPEQARGKSLDRRTDIWAFGCVLYELLAGRPAFQAETVSDTLVKVLESHPDWAALPADTPSAVRQLLRRTLEKDPAKRLRDVGDARLEIAEALLLDSHAELPSAHGRSSRQDSWARVAMLSSLAIAVAGGTYALGRLNAGASPGVMTQLTFRQGTTGKARFASDGQTVVYSASWDGEPFRLYTTHVGSAQSRAVDLPPADLMALSKSGDLAISPARPAVDGWEPQGILAVTALAGGAPRSLYDDVIGADWSADGKAMALAARTASGARLEFPAGTVIHESATNAVLPPRISPDGSRVCFFVGYGRLMVGERGRSARLLAEGLGRGGHCAWTPDGDEVWAESGGGLMQMNIEAFQLSGRRRVVASYPGWVQIEDISADGKLLISAGTQRFSAHGARRPGEGERELTVFDATRVHYLGGDQRIVLWDNSPAAGLARTFLRSLDGTPPVPMGPGAPVALSPTGEWLAVIGDGKTNERIRTKITLLPTGVGTARTSDLPIAIEPPGGTQTGRVDWERRTYDFSNDGTRLLIPFGRSADRPPSVHVYDLTRTSMTQVTPDGVTGPAVISPDGREVAVSSPEQITIYPVATRDPRPLPGSPEPGKVVRWSSDGRALLVLELHGHSARLFRRRVDTGERVPVWEIKAREPAGLTMFDVWVSGNGEAYAYSSLRRLSNLYVVEGLR